MTEAEKRAQAELEETYGKAPGIDGLDLTKVANAKAEKKNLSKSLQQTMSGSSVSSKKEGKKHFSFTEEHEVKLPTGGLLYTDEEDEDIRRGIVRLKSMTLADEETLSNKSFLNNGTTFYHLLNDCVMNDFDVRKFDPYDVYYLLYTLREISYGDDYIFTVKCSNCGHEHEIEVDIRDVVWKDFTEEEGIEPVKVIKLPRSKYTVTMRYAQLGDTEMISKKYKNSDYGDSALNYSVRTVEILDDAGQPVSPALYPEFYSSIPSLDRVEISDAFEVLDSADTPTVSVKCPKCESEEDIEIPMTLDFFRHRRR